MRIMKTREGYEFRPDTQNEEQTLDAMVESLRSDPEEASGESSRDRIAPGNFPGCCLPLEIARAELYARADRLARFAEPVEGLSLLFEIYPTLRELERQQALIVHNTCEDMLRNRMRMS